MPKSPAERKAAQRARQSADGERKLWGLLSLDIKCIIQIYLIKNRTL
ncbi:Uncharacterised protein [Klebsiella pneumoniae]|nr:Uncharacterised protein [Klebsiella pneumoniae]GKN51120.1 hypothetical protein NUKP84_46470 [Klebsiella variicola]SYF03185.1 Uncharacterised protein [Klebsiella pneumoniae]SYK44955.1 Uncharacterised protein [Klebsiella pneumoniae]VAT04584.1 Uncharacterised protein [Klebsiella pneumoniae]